MKDRQKLVVYRNLTTKGSIRDLIYKASYQKRYNEKYQVANKTPSTGLSEKEIQKYSYQILKALSFLKSANIPFPHLHTSNVLINKDGNAW
jgi:PX domain-containing protein kinase-like protein